MTKKQDTSKPKPPGKTFPLDVKARITLLNILPREADVVTVRILKDLKADLGLSEEEIKRTNIRQEGNMGLVWDKSKDMPKEIVIGPTGRGVIKSTLEKLDREKKITDDILPLWDMFC